jgi:hypothetical protein
MATALRYSTSTAGNHILSADGADIYCSFPPDSPVFNPDGSFSLLGLNALVGFISRLRDAVGSEKPERLNALCDNGLETGR